MNLLLLLCLTVPPFLTGRAVLQVLRWKSVSRFYGADALITGWIACIGATEAAHLTALFLGWPFSGAVRLFAVFQGLLFLAALGIVLYGSFRRRGSASARRAQKRRALRRQVEHRPYTVFQVGLFLLFALIVIYQLMQITVSGTVYIEGDMTVETVESFLETDAFYQINPLTGGAYEAGVPLRLKILCLPTLYGSLCRIFGLPGTEVVWHIVPVATLLGSYLAFYILAGCFFPEEGDREKRELFMLFAAVLFCVGDHMYGMDGLGLLYSGFRGVTIRNTVLLPYTFGLMLRSEQKRAVLCVLAEACIVWTLYGMGACLMAAVLMTALCLLRKYVEKGRPGAGEEARG